VAPLGVTLAGTFNLIGGLEGSGFLPVSHPKQNAPDYTSPWDVRSNSPPPKSAQSQSTVSGQDGEGHVRNNVLVTGGIAAFRHPLARQPSSAEPLFSPILLSETSRSSYGLMLNWPVPPSMS
jgi:hypothetical protein